MKTQHLIALRRETHQAPAVNEAHAILPADLLCLQIAISGIYVCIGVIRCGMVSGMPYCCSCY